MQLSANAVKTILIDLRNVKTGAFRCSRVAGAIRHAQTKPPDSGVLPGGPVTGPCGSQLVEPQEVSNLDDYIELPALVNVPLILPCSVVIELIRATAIRAASRAYSIAVAPDSHLAKRETKAFMTTLPNSVL